MRALIKYPTLLDKEQTKSRLKSSVKFKMFFPSSPHPTSFMASTGDALPTVVLIASGVRIPTSKALLVARSDFFAAMFSTPMKERDSDEVEIGEVESAEHFADFLGVLAGRFLPNRIFLLA
jgi:hypothetical protein